MAIPEKEPELTPAALASLGKLPKLQLTGLAWSAAHIVEQQQEREGARPAAEVREKDGGDTPTSQARAETQEKIREEQRKDVAAILRAMVALRDQAAASEAAQNTAKSPNPWDASNPFYHVETRELIELIPSAIRLAQKFGPAPATPPVPEKAEALTPISIFTKDPVDDQTIQARRQPQTNIPTPEQATGMEREKNGGRLGIDPVNDTPAATVSHVTPASPPAPQPTARTGAEKPAHPVDTQLIQRIAQGEYALAALDRKALRELFIATASYFREQTHATYGDIERMAGRGKNWFGNLKSGVTSVTPEAFTAFAQEALTRLQQAQAELATQPAQTATPPRVSAKAQPPARATLPAVSADAIAQLQSIGNASYPLAVLDRKAMRELFIATADSFKAQTRATHGDIEQMAGRGKNWYSNLKSGFTSVTVEEFRDFARHALERLGIPPEPVVPQATPPSSRHTVQPPLQERRSKESARLLAEPFVSDHPIAPVPKAWLKNHAAAVELLKIKMRAALPKKCWPQMEAALAGVQNAANVPRGQANTLGYAMTALQGGLSDSHFTTVRDLRGATLRDWKSNANLNDSSDNLHDFVKANGAFNGRVSTVLDSFTRILALHWGERMRKTQGRQDTLGIPGAGAATNGNGHALATPAADADIAPAAAGAASPATGTSLPWATRAASTVRTGEWADYVTARAAGTGKDRGSV